MGMSKRRSSQAVKDRNASIVSRIGQIKADHPFWGYRRIWAHLRYIDNITINKKRVYRLMHEHNLLVKPNTKLKAKRTINTRKPKADRPNQWWGIDMTKVKTTHEGWVYVVIVIDWYSKKVVGHYAGNQSKAWHWLVALHKAVNQQFPYGARGHKLNLMADNGCQPTSTSFMKACHHMDITLAFTSYNNPKGNADTERFMRTMKEEMVWCRQYNSTKAFIKQLDRWIEYYNAKYLHSTLGYMPPSTFENNFWINNQKTLLKSA